MCVCVRARGSEGGAGLVASSKREERIAKQTCLKLQVSLALLTAKPHKQLLDTHFEPLTFSDSQLFAGREALF